MNRAILFSATFDYAVYVAHSVQSAQLDTTMSSFCISVVH